ncbi:uncharacterized protein LOC117317949 [Pecten maximus]|uniref:uncharacterized protein LOC117317949 n=1 Tax=Pecten maximus TaxID=6579 RepID=UPI00145807B1|nr:uncharacterized protein LOC117317949 [Pecten maximus]
MTYGNQSVQASAITLENNMGIQVPITANSDPCVLFAATTTASCGDGKTCEVIGGNATCVEIQSSDEWGSIVGLSVAVFAVPLLITLVLVRLCTRTWSRRNQQKFRPQGTAIALPTRFHAKMSSWSHLQPSFYYNNWPDLSESEMTVPASFRDLPLYNNVEYDKPRMKRDRRYAGEDTY